MYWSYLSAEKMVLRKTGTGSNPGLQTNAANRNSGFDPVRFYLFCF